MNYSLFLKRCCLEEGLGIFLTAFILTVSSEEKPVSEKKFIGRNGLEQDYYQQTCQPVCELQFSTQN